MWILRFQLIISVLVFSNFNGEDGLIISRPRLVTAIVKVRHFHARSAYYANTDATQTGGRFHVSLLLIMAGDVELNPGPQPSSRKRAALQRYRIGDGPVSSPSSQHQTLDPPHTGDKATEETCKQVTTVEQTNEAFRRPKRCTSPVVTNTIPKTPRLISELNHGNANATDMENVHSATVIPDSVRFTASRR